MRPGAEGPCENSEQACGLTATLPGVPPGQQSRKERSVSEPLPRVFLGLSLSQQLGSHSYAMLMTGGCCFYCVVAMCRGL